MIFHTVYRLPRRLPYAFVAVLLVFGLISACSDSDPFVPVSVSGPTMGTGYNIKYFRSPKSLHTDRQIEMEIEKIFSRVNELMSTYSEDSEVSRFNRAPGNTWFPISDETYSVIELALNVSEMTNGAFDITVAGLVDLWGFGPSPMPEKIPEPGQISSLLQRVGYSQLLLKDDPNSILKRTDLNIDLSAVAKGYAVDLVADYLNSTGIESYLVELGGEVKARGAKKDMEPWRIAIESPVVQKRAIQKVVQLNNQAIATSGDYRNYFEQNGHRYSHTINPGTGYPVTHRLASVTVIDESTARADALATAFMVLGDKQGLVFAEANHVAALFIVKTDNGFEEIMSTSFNEQVKTGSL